MRSRLWPFKPERQSEVAEQFEKQGFTRKLAKLYRALNPDGEATPEDVKAFAAEYEVMPTRAVGYTPTTVSNEGRVPAAKTYTRAEMEEIAKQTPLRARALAEAGRIKWNNPADRREPMTDVKDLTTDSPSWSRRSPKVAEPPPIK